MSLVAGMKVRYAPQPEWGVGHLVALEDQGRRAHSFNGWRELRPHSLGQHIVDLGGNQAVDCLLYDAADTTHRYSAAETITAQGNIFLVAGSVLRSNESVPMATVAATTCEYHDTIGGACSRESNTLRYGHHTADQHACVDNFLDVGLRGCVRLVA